MTENRVETRPSVKEFRFRLFVIIALVVMAMTGLGAVLTHHHLARTFEEEFLNSISHQVEASLESRRLRQAILGGICRDLARKSRIHAALEDDALDLLYPSAANELRNIMMEPSQTTTDGEESVRAAFYRFLDASGKPIIPGDPSAHGIVPEGGLELIRIPGVPDKPQIGYCPISANGSVSGVIELITVPIISNETFVPIAALAVGFPLDLEGVMDSGEPLQFGMLIDGVPVLPQLPGPVRNALAKEIGQMGNHPNTPRPGQMRIERTDYRMEIRLLNPDSDFPPAYGLYLTSLEPLQARQARARNGIVVAALLLLAGGSTVAHLISRKFSRPVEDLAAASLDADRKRISAEEALDTTSRELERAARFSADASHQLKTPVAVLRAGLEEILVDPVMPEPLKGEVKAMIFQTGRLTRVIEDLLLLSRADAGRLNFELEEIDLRMILEGLADDFSILPQSREITLDLRIDQAFRVMGSRTYTGLILQNLMENAWKFNRPGGKLRVVVTRNGEQTECRVGNNGPGVPTAIQNQIFERFHRGSSGENVPGYGLGLNLAMQLTKLHGGSLRLVESGNDWTEFALVLRSANSPESGL